LVVDHHVQGGARHYSVDHVAADAVGHLPQCVEGDTALGFGALGLGDASLADADALAQLPG
jgi:hypothetical protein